MELDYIFENFIDCSYILDTNIKDIIELKKMKIKDLDFINEKQQELNNVFLLVNRLVDISLIYYYFDYDELGSIKKNLKQCEARDKFNDLIIYCYDYLCYLVNNNSNNPSVLKAHNLIEGKENFDYLIESILEDQYTDIDYNINLLKDICRKNSLYADYSLAKIYFEARTLLDSKKLLNSFIELANKRARYNLLIDKEVVLFGQNGMNVYTIEYERRNKLLCDLINKINKTDHFNLDEINNYYNYFKNNQYFYYNSLNEQEKMLNICKVSKKNK